MRSLKTGDAHNGAHDKIGIGMRGAGDGSCRAMDNFNAGDASGLEARGELARKLFCSQRDDLRTPADSLGKGFVDVAAGSQRSHRVALGKLLNDGEGALADRASGAENSESFQGISSIASRLHYRANGAHCTRKPSLAHDLRVPQHRRSQQQRIDAVEDAAMPR